ncbi:hypothetical protein GCM10023231_20970 [Olivibacter ginsenosidimutans]|uniref:Uncharacterized protein n=2 Tax=Olivibacter ginsenosidimutans TaxID=1176537 RepID=A0ABP9BCA6_9SPHI
MVVTLTGSTELGQLLRLPILFWHFHEHQERDEAMTFVDFLKLHYETADNKKEFDPKDSSLPFKSCQCALTAHFVALPPTTLTMPLKPISLFATTIPLRNDSENHSSYLSNIWQPPKFG